MNSDGDWLFKVVPWFIGGVFVLIIVGAISYGIVIYKGLEFVADCHPAIVSSTKDGQTATTIACKKP